MITRKFLGFAVAAFAVVAAGVYAAAVIERESRVGWARYEPAAPAGESESRVASVFLGDASAEARYAALVRYLLDGFMRHASADGAHVHYGGAGSNAGYFADGLEGFARTVPLFAAWLHGGRESVVEIDSGERIDLVALLARGIAAGIDPESPAYWGDIAERFDQRTVEAVDVARTLWLTRAWIWDRWPERDRANAIRWLDGVNRIELRDGNWALFPIVVNLILDDLEDRDHVDAAGATDTDGVGGSGAGDAASGARRRAAASDAFAEYVAEHYLESGWFSDDPRGVDYYNAWSISYELFWIRRIAPDFHAQFIARALDESAQLTAHLISPAGIPILGRSICYRTAVTAPVVAASLLGHPQYREGLGLRALDAVWRYFVRHDALRDGALTQGYFGEDLRIVDNYSGTGSCHWGLRSLVLAYLHGPQSAFWNAAPAPLPVEAGDYRIDLPKLGWTVTGTQAGQEIVIDVTGNDADVLTLEPVTWRRRALEILTRRPHRPSNRPAKYDLARYSSARPFMADDALPAP